MSHVSRGNSTFRLLLSKVPSARRWPCSSAFWPSAADLIHVKHQQEQFTQHAHESKASWETHLIFNFRNFLCARAGTHFSARLGIMITQGRTHARLTHNSRHGGLFLLVVLPSRAQLCCGSPAWLLLVPQTVGSSTTIRRKFRFATAGQHNTIFSTEVSGQRLWKKSRSTWVQLASRRLSLCSSNKDESL